MIEEDERRKYVLFQSEIAIGNEDDFASLDEIYDRVISSSIMSPNDYSREDLEEDIEHIDVVEEFASTESESYYTLSEDVETIEPDMGPSDRQIERLKHFRGEEE